MSGERSRRQPLLEMTVVFQWDIAKRHWFCTVYHTPPPEHRHARSKAYRLLIPVPAELYAGEGDVLAKVLPIETRKE